MGMEMDAGMEVFGEGLGLESPDFHQRLAAEEPPASSEECAVMPVASSLQSTEEEGLFVVELVVKAQIPLKDVRIVEMVRRLDEGDSRIVQGTDCVFQEG